MEQAKHNRRYAGNIFIEPLPAKYDVEEFFNKVEEKPDFTQEDSNASHHEKKAMLNALTSEYFEPLGRHYYLYERFVDVLFEGYKVRTPQTLLPTLKKCREWNYAMGVNKAYTPPRNNKIVHGFSLIGTSGMGKTETINKILKLFPQVIHQPSLQTYQVVHLKINCSAIGSTKQLCLEFFNALDKVLGSDYYDKYKSRHTEDQLMIHMANVAAIQCLGVLIIDEIQHLKYAKTGNAEKMLNFFKNLSDSIGVPIVFIGVPEASEVIHGNFQQARRSQGVGAIVWSSLKNNPSEWKVFAGYLWGYQLLSKPGLLTDEIRDTYLDLTDGIIDLVVKLHVCAQKLALELGVATLSREIIVRASEMDLGATKSMIDALRRKDPGSYNLVKDIDVKAAQRHLNIIQADSKEIEKANSHKNLYEAKFKMDVNNLLIAIRGEIEEGREEELKQYALEICCGFPDLSLKEKYMRLVASFPESTKKEKKEPKEAPQGMLLEHYFSALEVGNDVYSFFKEKNLIKDPFEDCIK